MIHYSVAAIKVFFNHSSDLIHLGNNWLCWVNQINGITGLSFWLTLLTSNVILRNEPSEPTTELFPTVNVIWTSLLKLDQKSLGRLIKMPFLEARTHTQIRGKTVVEMVCLQRVNKGFRFFRLVRTQQLVCHQTLICSKELMLTFVPCDNYWS